MDRIGQLKTFLLKTPDDPFLNHALALEYIKAGNDAIARTLFEEILSKTPSYTGSYYHLGKLLERQGEIPLALESYEKGIEVARKAGDHHSLSELKMAREHASDPDNF